MKTLLTEKTSNYYGVGSGVLCLDRRYGLKYGSDGYTKRIGHRRRTLALMALIGDGKSTFLCIVDELSEKGIRLTQIPSSFNETAEKYTALILSPFNNLRITLHSRWSKITNGGMYKTIGFQLNVASFEWLRFINGLQKKSGVLPYLLSRVTTE